ncbi:FIST C-terminal domain-containing protein [Bacterioplanoides pacificum]|uniref:FIST C-terminal domain-containing protein n=1 Tax=Bacterioplanoides pacificum TaxID=1171596 RepID=A0ABV7VPU9_9GAMM
MQISQHCWQQGHITPALPDNTPQLVLIFGNEAAQQACRNATSLRPEFALLISCVGRRSVLQQLVDEELETLSETLRRDIPHAGFYSYGEIAPYMGLGPCNLHNQTMTITTFAEQE